MDEPRKPYRWYHVPVMMVVMPFAMARIRLAQIGGGWASWWRWWWHWNKPRWWR